MTAGRIVAEGNAAELLGWLWPSVIAVIVMYTLSGSTVPGTTFSLGSQAIPGILGMSVVVTGMMGLAAALTMEREDGILLRMKAIPNGMVGYLERGEYSPSLYLALRIAEYFEVPVEVVFSTKPFPRLGSQAV